MVSPGQLYVGVITVLLLVALGVSIPVLTRIVRDGLERRRERQAGERERDTADEEYDRITTAAELDEDAEGSTRLRCRQCGAENDPTFTYCRRCATSL